MLEIHKKMVLDEDERPFAVQIPIKENNLGTYLSYLRNRRANPEGKIRDLIQSL